MRCKKAGVDTIVASGHEGGFHTSWEPVHSMVLPPAVLEEISDNEALVVGEAAQRIKDMPKVNDLVQEIVREAETILTEVPKKVLSWVKPHYIEDSGFLTLLSG